MDSRAATFKNTLLLGLGQFTKAIIGFIRSKIVALLIGPAGIGIMGIYTTIITLVGSTLGLGIDKIGIKQVAEYYNSKDKKKLVLVIQAIRSCLFLSGFIGSVILCVFRVPIGRMNFGSNYQAYIPDLVIVSMCLLFDSLASAESIIIQGAKKIKQILLAQLLSSFLGASISIVIIYSFRIDGIAFSVTIVSLVSFLVTRLFSSQLFSFTNKFSLSSIPQLICEIRGLLSVGKWFLITGVIANILVYLLRYIIINYFTLELFGVYQATYGLISVLFNLILNAIGTELFPRFVSISDNNPKLNKIINEQTELNLLIIFPLILVAYLYSPFFLKLFFSSEFIIGTDLMRWLLVSCYFRLAAYPLGYLMIAKNKYKLSVFSSLCFELFHVGLLLICVKIWQFNGVGISYFINYASVTFISTFLCKRRFDFRWSKRIIRMSVMLFVTFCILFVLTKVDNRLVHFVINPIFIVISLVFSYKVLTKNLGIDLISAIHRISKRSK